MKRAPEIDLLPRTPARRTFNDIVSLIAFNSLFCNSLFLATRDCARYVVTKPFKRI